MSLAIPGAHLLGIVEHQQQVLVGKHLLERRQQRCAACFRNVQRTRDRRQNKGGVAEGRQLHHAHAIAEHRGNIGGDVQR